MPAVGQTTTIAGVGLHRLVIPSTFIANVSDITLRVPGEVVSLAEFHLSKGAWVVQAKAIVQAVGGFDPDHPQRESLVRVQLSLVAQTDHNGLLDKANVGATSAEATIVAMLGIQSSTTILLSLRGNNLRSALPGGEVKITDIVITAIKQTELISLAV